MKFKINTKIFDKYPDLFEVIVVLKDIKPTKQNNEILKLLREEEKAIQKSLQHKDLKDFPSIQKWREVFKDFGSDPKSYASSIDAIFRRLKDGNKLPDIHPLVNLYNLFSIKYKLPFGGEDFKGLAGNLELKYCNGNENFVPILKNKNKSADKGEIAWVDREGVTCRKWNWQQSDRTKITKDTREAYFIIDGMPPVTKMQVKEAAESFIKTAEKYFCAQGKVLWLDKDNPEEEVEVETGPLQERNKMKKNKKRTKTKSKAGFAKPNLHKIIENKNLLKNKIEEEIWQCIKKSKFKTLLDKKQVKVEYPKNEKYGDFATNVAMILAGKVKINPQEVFNVLKGCFKDEDLFSSVEFVGGFINFKISENYMVKELKKILKQGSNYGISDLAKEKTWLLEHTSPNPNKAMHLGHLRNNVTGMAIGNLWEALGINVVRDCIDNNRGIAIAKLMWGYLKFAKKEGDIPTDIEYWYDHQDEWLTPKDSEKRPDKFMDELYIKASNDFKKNKDTEENVRKMVVDWEAGDKKNRSLWEKVLKYVYEGHEMTLDRLNSKWDNVWHEHEHYQMGKDMVRDALKEDIFKRSEGAIVTNLEEYGIPDTVVIKSNGTALYITQDIALTKLKIEKFNADKLFWVTGPEQKLALQQMFAVCEQLGIGLINDFIHIPYGYMSIKGKGKMSSRLGNVVYIDELIDIVKEKVKTFLTEKEFSKADIDKIAEKIAVGSVKYSILKVGRMTNTAFDIEESISFEGNSAPYLQYTYARGKSILRKSRIDLSSLENLKFYQEDELNILRTLIKYEEIVHTSALQIAPNLLCNYLFDLAQKFNLFYKKHKVVGSTKEKSRLALTAAVAQVIENGLNLLGIEVLEKM